jgi:sulfur carrier protein
MLDSIATSIILNGDPYPLDADLPLTALLERLNMRRTRVAVEINHQIVPRARYDETIVRAGDHVEIINFVGGG